MASTFPRVDASAAPESDLGGRLLRAACHVFDVSEAQLQSSDRGEVSQARWALAYVLTETCGWSCLRVARLLHKDHTTILYGVRRAKALLRSSELFFEVVRMIEDEA